MFNAHRVFTMLAPATLMVLTVSFLPKLALAADDEQEAKSVTLHYRSQELNTPQGTADLYRRIRVAATGVCSPLEGPSLERKVLWEKCFNHAVGNAVVAVHNETLSAYHWQHIRGWKQPRMEAPSALASR